ncbi:MAG: pilus assembly FimT family protein [Verrucomicrobiia bacterium]
MSGNHTDCFKINRVRLSGGKAERAFTLVELLVVISIIGIIFYLSLPALRDITKSDAMGVANRQLMDDIARARRLAINHRTMVYLVFVPPNITNYTASLPQDLADRYERLAMSGYGFFARRTAGEQPGRERPRYFGEWRSLPEGIFIAPWKFIQGTNSFAFSYQLFPFPNTNYPEVYLPCFAFNYLGQVTHFQAQDEPVLNEYDEVIPLTRGSMLISTNGNARVMDFQEIPPGNSTNNFNYIRVDWLTGRCRIERPEIF